MIEKTVTPRSILEDIFDEMFNIIEKNVIFSKKTIQKLKKLAYEGDFTKEKSIIEVIESELEEEE